MPAASRAPHSAAASFETDAQHLAASLDRRRYLVLLLLTLFYAAGALRHAHNKSFWYDEVITLISASAPDAAGAWKTALQTDANPPLPHLLTHFAMQWFGPGETAVRLPAILGFWIFCLCLFRFTRRRVGIYYALVALLLPIATQAYSYAYEARAYGPELAFCGLALVSWQMAAEGPRRRLAYPVLALSLIGALLCHYYAILLYVPLAGAEAFRAWRARRIDWGIWVAFALGGSPVVWRLATISRVVQQFSQTTWSPAYPGQVMEFWENGLQHTLSFVVLLAAILALWMIGGRARPDAPKTLPPALAGHELVSGVLFLAIPIVAVGAGLFVTHMFTARYALLALTGVAILAPMIAAWLSDGRALPGFLLLIVALIPLGFVAVDVPAPSNPNTDEPILVKALQQGPVVVADGQLFLQMWHYAPVPLKSNLLFLADNAAAVKYMGFDAIDVGVRALRPWAPVPVVEYKDFAAPGREFLLYQSTLRPGWLLASIVAGGGSAELVTYTNLRQLYRVRLPLAARP
ncbi:MAG TPA: glycosyltransferase family 39 protein [Bryobacteraceae bacterium]|nr:glycosyltransferase family 39 protein [Bryobacteraceae bacterium]